MEKLYQDYKDIAEFYMVYITEAHAEDDRRPVPYAKELGIKEHTTFGQRCRVATRLLSDKKLTIPCLADNMDNAVQDAYQARPDRIFLVRKDGLLAVAGSRGPWGFKPALGEVEAWLASYKASGAEPPIPDPSEKAPDFYELSADLNKAYTAGNIKEALAIGERMLALQPEGAGTLYNVACMHALLGQQEKAYARLEQAIEAGYDDAEHLTADDDFKTIRDQQRFRDIVRNLREKVKPEGRQRSRPTTPSGGVTATG